MFTKGRRYTNDAPGPGVIAPPPGPVANISSTTSQMDLWETRGDHSGIHGDDENKGPECPNPGFFVLNEPGPKSVEEDSGSHENSRFLCEERPGASDNQEGISPSGPGFPPSGNPRAEKGHEESQKGFDERLPAHADEKGKDGGEGSNQNTGPLAFPDPAGVG